jgi:hypothetical protein
MIMLVNFGTSNECVGSPCFGVLQGYMEKGYHMVHCWGVVKDCPKWRLGY